MIWIHPNNTSIKGKAKLKLPFENAIPQMEVGTKAK